jgi:hypothetical protein
MHIAGCCNNIDSLNRVSGASRSGRVGHPDPQRPSIYRLYLEAHFTYYLKDGLSRTEHLSTRAPPHIGPITHPAGVYSGIQWERTKYFRSLVASRFL